MGDVRDFQPGWSIARLADEFGIDRRTATKRIREGGVPPLGKRGGNDVYRLADVAGVLVGGFGAVGPGAVVDPRDLPPTERRAWFQSENERLAAEQTIGTLVPAAEVESDYAALVKLVVQFFDTLPDVLERDCELTPAQVVRVQEACDAVRQKMYDSVMDDGIRDRALHSPRRRGDAATPTSSEGERRGQSSSDRQAVREHRKLGPVDHAVHGRTAGHDRQPALRGGRVRRASALREDHCAD
jgi:hypothetical protein